MNLISFFLNYGCKISKINGAVSQLNSTTLSAPDTYICIDYSGLIKMFWNDYIFRIQSKLDKELHVATNL